MMETINVTKENLEEVCGKLKGILEGKRVIVNYCIGEEHVGLILTSETTQINSVTLEDHPFEPIKYINISKSKTFTTVRSGNILIIDDKGIAKIGASSHLTQFILQ